jgi:hypothetical protein
MPMIPFIGVRFVAHVREELDFDLLPSSAFLFATTSSAFIPCAAADPARVI